MGSARMSTREPAALAAKLAEGRTAEVFAWGDGRILKLFREDWGKETAEQKATSWVGQARVRCVLIAALAVLGMCTLVTGCSSTTSSATPLTCQTDQLDLVRGQSDFAATHVAVALALHNHSSQTCMLDGYPGVQLFDAQGHIVPIHLQQVTSAYMFNTQPV